MTDRKAKQRAREGFLLQVYAAITMDIVGSTQVYQTSNQPLRPRLLDVIELTNSRFRDDLAVPFRITLGDEFQGLVHNLSACPQIVSLLRLHLNPLRCRIGVGIGSVASAPAPSTLDMEGIAFSMSRKALESAKKQGSFTLYRMSDDSRLERAANIVSMLVDTIQGEWSEKQWEAARAYFDHPSTTAAALSLHVSRQAVDQRLRLAHYHEIQEAMDGLSRLLASHAQQAA